MTDDRRHAGFTDLSPVTRNRTRLPRSAGRLRLVFTLCAMFGAAQLLVPVIARFALNGGRVWPTDDVHSLWGSAIDDPVLGVPAWVTIVTGAVGMAAALWYLGSRARDAGSDAPYVSLVSLLIFGGFPWAIAALDADPTGIIRTPGPDGYPIGWHWVLSPVALVVLVVGIIVSVRSSRDARRRREAGRALRAAARSDREDTR
jgi:uncharacterized membrane protein